MSRLTRSFDAFVACRRERMETADFVLSCQLPGHEKEVCYLPAKNAEWAL